MEHINEMIFHNNYMFGFSTIKNINVNLYYMLEFGKIKNINMLGFGNIRNINVDGYYETKPEYARDEHNKLGFGELIHQIAKLYGGGG